MPIKARKGEDIFYTHILTTLNTIKKITKNKQYYFSFKLAMITVHYYLCNLSSNETSYFQQALYYMAKINNDIEIINHKCSNIFFYILLCTLYLRLFQVSSLFFNFFSKSKAKRTELSMKQSFNTFTNKSNKHCKYNNVNVKKRWKQKCTLLNASSLYIVDIFHLENSRKIKMHNFERNETIHIYTYTYTHAYIYIHRHTYMYIC